MLRISVSLVAALAAASGACAQAVEWRVADGGNGHWYRCFVSDEPMNFYDAVEIQLAFGGHLATLTSAQENQFAVDLSAATPGGWFGGAGPWLGGLQDTHLPEYSEPDGGWGWVTGEPWSFTAWGPGEPSNGCLGWIGENIIHLQNPTCDPVPAGFWNDRFPGGVFCPSCGIFEIHSCIIEWEDDCNGDGIVDYGQILSGILGDVDANGVPDCCENRQPTTCAGDLNGDSAVNGADLSILLGYWGLPSADLPPGSDTDCDSVITGADLAAVLAAWGACP